MWDLRDMTRIFFLVLYELGYAFPRDELDKKGSRSNDLSGRSGQPPRPGLMSSGGGILFAHQCATDHCEPNRPEHPFVPVVCLYAT